MIKNFLKKEQRFRSLILTVLIISISLSTLLIILSLRKQLELENFSYSTNQNGEALYTNQRLVLSFSRPLKSQNFDESNPPAKFTPDIKASFTVSRNKLIIAPQELLSPSQEYKISFNSNLQDIYGNTFNSDLSFTTASEKLAFIRTLEAQNQLVLLDASDFSEKILYTGEKFELFDINKDYFIIFLPESQEIAIYSLQSLEKVHSLSMSNQKAFWVEISSINNEIVFVSQPYTDGVPSDIERVFHFSLDSKELKEFDPMETAQDVKFLELSPDGKYVLYQGLNQYFYIASLQNPEKFINLGDHISSGGFSLNGDVISFLTISASQSKTTFPYIQIKSPDGESQTSFSETSEQILDPFSLSQNSEVYFARRYQDLPGTKGLYAIYSEKDTNIEEVLKQEGFSLELPKISASSNYLFAEKYTVASLKALKELRGYNFYAKPINSSIIIYDLKEKEIIKEYHGYSLKFLY